MKHAVCIFLALLLAPVAFAQFTTVSATVVDPQGVPYAFGTVVPLFVTSGTPTFTATGQLYMPPNQATGLDKNGSFIVRLADDTTISPGGTTWNFKVCSAVGTVLWAWGTGPVCFTLAAPITISGSSQSISTQLNAVAVNLTQSLGGGGSIPLPANPQTGDTLRYNVNADSAWDAVNFALPISIATAQIGAGGSIGVVGYGSIIGSPTLAASATQAIIAPNLSNGVGDTITSPAATASTSTITGINHGAATNIGTVGVGSFYRLSFKFAATATTNVRYWMGYANYNTGGGSGTENVSVLNTTSLASDTPSRGLIGFRFSAGTDSNWQAVACLPAGTCTVTDTGVAIDTSVHQFDVIPQISGTSVAYMIDGAHLKTISTNVPPPNLGIASAGSTGSVFWVGDNKNTANAVSGNFYWLGIAPK